MRWFTFGRINAGAMRQPAPAGQGRSRKYQAHRLPVYKRVSLTMIASRELDVSNRRRSRWADGSYPV